jgi:hypothetical protein
MGVTFLACRHASPATDAALWVYEELSNQAGLLPKKSEIRNQKSAFLN